MTNENRIYVRLKGNIAKQFSHVKEYLGLTSDSEVLRFLISDYSRKISQEKYTWRAIER